MTQRLTLNRVLFMAVPVVALLSACGRLESPAPANKESSSSPSEAGVADESAREATLEEGETPVAVVDDETPDGVADGPEQINQDGAPISEAGTHHSDGSERNGNFNPGAAAAAGADGVASGAQALSGDRRSTFLGEVKRQYGWLKESTSYYSHTIYNNEDTGTRRTDCSGYIDYALSRVLRSSYDLVNNATAGSSAKAEDFFDYFMGRPTSASTNTSVARWRKIKAITDLKPGDVIVWKNPSWMENSGHAMVVRDYPRAGRTSRNELLVPIYDSTESPHAYNAWDSRGTARNGVGAGTLGVKVNSAGEGIAYYWTGGTSTSATYRTIIGGRIE